MRTPSPVERRVGGLLLLASGSLALSLVRAAHERHASFTWVAVTLVVLALGELRILSARVGGQPVAISLVELAAMVGLALVPGEWVVITGAVAAFGVSLTQKRPALKRIFNVSQAVAGLQVAVFIAGNPPSLSEGIALVPDLRLAAAALAYGLGSVLVTAAVTAAAGNTTIVRNLRNMGWLHVSAVGANVFTGLSLLLLAQLSPATLIVVPPMVAAVYLTYSLYLRADAERATWQRLERAGADLIALAVDDVASHAVGHACQLFGCEGADLTLNVASQAGTSSWATTAAGVDRDVTSAWAQGLQALPRTDGLSPAITVDDGATRVSGIACELMGPQGQLGFLVLRFAGDARLTPRERQVLSSYSRTVAAALSSATLYEQACQEAEQKAYEAAHDGLTGLANRMLLHETITASIAKLAEPGARGCGLLLVDLDNFKSVNDTLGHSTGDRLLRLVADRLRDVVGDRGLVSRLGGDEFAVLVPNITDPRTAEWLAADILRVLREPAHLDGLRLSVGGSVGVACAPQDASSAEELFQHADVALYQAKDARGVARRYSSEHDSSSISRLELVAELGLALERDEFVLHYQPQSDIQLGALVGVEALVRWNHPVRGLLMPQDFVEAVEHSGLIRAFTRWVLDQAVRDCAAWHREGRALTVAVNLSARNLLDPALPDDVADVLNRHRLPADALVLEITETAMMGDITAVEAVLSALRSLGVQLSVDDFGTGYSSLAFLQRVRVNEIKVDRTFVFGMLGNEGDKALVRATVDLARSFRLRVVAEGVETAALLGALGDLGCDVAQGWHIGRPGDLATTRERLGLPPLHEAGLLGFTPSQRGPVPLEVRSPVAGG